MTEGSITDMEKIGHKISIDRTQRECKNSHFVSLFAFMISQILALLYIWVFLSYATLA